MKPLRALFVDDETTLRDQYIENLTIALRDNCNVELAADAVTRVEDAKNRLSRDHPYQLVVVDLLWDALGGSAGDLDPRGLEVVEQAAKRDDVVIVAISVGDTARFPDLREQAIDSGADVFRFRGSL